MKRIGIFLIVFSFLGMLTLSSCKQDAAESEATEEMAPAEEEMEPAEEEMETPAEEDDEMNEE